MVTMRNIPTPIATLLTLLVLVAASSGSAGAAEPKELFMTHKCNLCHAVEAVGIEAKVKSEKMKGPELSGYAATDTDSLEAFLRKEETLNETEHKRAYEGSREELDQLLKWLAELKKAE